MPILQDKYFNLKEVCNFINNNGGAAPTQARDTSVVSYWFTGLLTTYAIKKYDLTTLDSSYSSTADSFIAVLMNIVFDRHFKDYCVLKQGTLHDILELDSGDVRDLLVKLVNIIEITAPRYIPLLKEFKGNSGDPIAPISSTSSGRTRFNDTPQNQGEYNDEAHATNVSDSSSTTSVDVGSIMERLEALYQNFRSIILLWANEFNQVFLVEEQL